MSDTSQPVSVHSVAEAYLYLKVTPCPACGKGPLEHTADLTRRAAAPGGWEMATRCGGCGYASNIAYAISPSPSREQAQSSVINPTQERSAAIDLLGWLMLFQAILEASQKEADRQHARELAQEAAQCLDEALKFYAGNSEFPNEDAFFSEYGRARLRDHRQQFARSLWQERRLKLPNPSSHSAAPRAAKRRWWQFWRRDPDA